MADSRLRRHGLSPWEMYRNVYYQTIRSRARKDRQPEDVAGFGLERLIARGEEFMQVHPDPLKFANLNYPNLVKDYLKNQRAQMGEGARRGRSVWSLDTMTQGPAGDGPGMWSGPSDASPWLATNCDTAAVAIDRADRAALERRILRIISRDDWYLIVQSRVYDRSNEDLAAERGVDPSCVSKRINAALRRIRESGIEPGPWTA